MIIKPADRLGGVKTYYFAIKLAEIDRINKESPIKVINLGIGSPDLLPPQESIDRLNAASKDRNAHQYQPYRSILSLRQAFAQWYQTHFEVKLQAETEILPLIGSKEGIMHISMAFINPGDQVLIPDPGYPAYAAITELCQGEIIKYPLTEEQNWWPDVKALSRLDLSAVKMMWINYPHMPTGAKGDLTLLHELVDFAKKHKILLCHDNPYTFILNDKPLSIFQVDGAKDVALELTSLSKNYNMSGWRIGSLAGRSDYIDTVLTFKSNMDSGMYKPIQEGAIEALQLDDSWFKSLNDIYARRKKIAHRIMDSLRCTYDPESAGLFVWGKIPAQVENAEKLCDQILLDSKVFITPGHIFGDMGNRYIRISLCADEETLDQALKRIEKIYKFQEI